MKKCNILSVFFSLFVVGFFFFPKWIAWLAFFSLVNGMFTRIQAAYVWKGSVSGQIWWNMLLKNNSVMPTWKQQSSPLMHTDKACSFPSLYSDLTQAKFQLMLMGVCYVRTTAVCSLVMARTFGSWVGLLVSLIHIWCKGEICIFQSDVGSLNHSICSIYCCSPYFKSYTLCRQNSY